MQGRIKGFKHSDETKKKISDANKRYMAIPENREKFRKNAMGKRGKISDVAHKRRFTLEYSETMRKKLAKPTDDLLYAVRENFRYRAWRKAILERDNNECVKCSALEEGMHVHHKVPIISIINSNREQIHTGNFDVPLLYDTNNGMTLCKTCHALEHGKMRSIKKENLGRVIIRLNEEILKRDKIITELQETINGLK